MHSDSAFEAGPGQDHVQGRLLGGAVLDKAGSLGGWRQPCNPLPSGEGDMSVKPPWGFSESRGICIRAKRCPCLKTVSAGPGVLSKVPSLNRNMVFYTPLNPEKKLTRQPFHPTLMAPKPLTLCPLKRAVAQLSLCLVRVSWHLPPITGQARGWG